MKLQYIPRIDRSCDYRIWQAFQNINWLPSNYKNTCNNRKRNLLETTPFKWKSLIHNLRYTYYRKWAKIASERFFGKNSEILSYFALSRILTGRNPASQHTWDKIRVLCHQTFNFCLALWIMDIEQTLDKPLSRGVRFFKWSIDEIIAEQKQETAAANAPAVHVKSVYSNLECASRPGSEA